MFVFNWKNIPAWDHYELMSGLGKRCRQVGWKGSVLAELEVG